jgi:hypothetical protein
MIFCGFKLSQEMFGTTTRHIGVVCKIVHVAQPEVGINISFFDEGDIMSLSKEFVFL